MYSSGFRVQGLEGTVQGSGFRVWGLGEPLPRSPFITSKGGKGTGFKVWVRWNLCCKEIAAAT